MPKLLVILTVILTLASVGFSEPLVEIANPKIKWSFKTQGPVRSPVSVDGKTVYCGSSDGALYALNKSDGSLVWKFQTQGAITGGFAVTDEAIVSVSRDDHAYAIDRVSGKLRWKFEMQASLPSGYGGWDYFTAAPVVEGDRVFVASGDGSLYALNLENGELDWRFETNGAIRATPLFDDGILYQPSNDGAMYAVRASDGKLSWKFETDGATYDSSSFGFDRNSIYDQPNLRDRLLVFGSRDGNVYGVDIDTRKESWRFTYGSTWAMSSSIEGDTAYVGWSTNDLICALDANTGKEKWKFQCEAHTYAEPLPIGNDIYFASADGNLYQFDKHTGKKSWSYSVGSAIYSSPAADSEALYLGADDGYLYAIEDGETAQLRVYHPSQIDGKTCFAVVDAEITPYLESHGFERLNTEESLHAFLRSRVADKAPSAVVLAFDIVPSEIIGDDPTAGLLRQYLETGGKILSFGSVLNQSTFDADGNFHRDPSLAPRLLDVTFDKSNESGSYYSKPTQLGLNCGLPNWVTTTNATVEPKGVLPLAIDELGRVSAWIKKLNPRPGSGFVSCRTWGYNTKPSQTDLELIRALAVHELE